MTSIYIYRESEGKGARRERDKRKRREGGKEGGRPAREA